MPNWCEGYLKVRGAREDLIEFMTIGIAWNTDGYPCSLTVERWNEQDEGVGFAVASSTNNQADPWLHIKGTTRHFIVMDSDYYWVPNGGVLVLHMNAAWYIHTDELLEICRKYNLDMKIQGFDRGAEFMQDVEIIGGEIRKNEEVEYDDWSWDCPCPTFGG